jgi:hypothetical protein
MYCTSGELATREYGWRVPCETVQRPNSKYKYLGLTPARRNPKSVHDYGQKQYKLGIHQIKQFRTSKRGDSDEHSLKRQVESIETEEGTQYKKIYHFQKAPLSAEKEYQDYTWNTKSLG